MIQPLNCGFAGRDITNEEETKMQKVKVTKRQRKLLGRNYMVKQSKKLGQIQQVGQTVYRGAPPELTPFYAYAGAPVQYRKTKAGIPFVRA